MTGRAKLGFLTGRLGGRAGAGVGTARSFSAADDVERDIGGVAMGEGEVRDVGFVRRLGSGGLGDVGREGGRDCMGISSLDSSLTSMAGDVLGIGSTGEDSSTTTRSGDFVGISVLVGCVCMDRVTSGSGPERALPERAADLGGTAGLGLDGPATAPPPNLSFIALTDTGSESSAPAAPPMIGSPLVSVPLRSGSLGCISRSVVVDPFFTVVGAELGTANGPADDGVDPSNLDPAPESLAVPLISCDPSREGAIPDGVRGRDTGRIVFGAGVVFEEVLLAASDSKRDLSDAIDTGASSTFSSLTAGSILGSA